MKKWMLYVTLAVALLLSLAQGALAEVLASGECGDDVTWAMDDQGTLTLSGIGPMKEYASVEGDNVWLYSPPFWNWDKTVSIEESRRKIRRVVVEEGITTIGGGIFRDLDGLESIKIASTVTQIGMWAFDKDTALPRVTIPNGVKRIEDSTFSDCTALKEVVLPESVTYIGPWSFYHTGLQKIDIPAAVTAIEERAFYECLSLKSINVDTKNKVYKSADGALFTADGTEMICYGAGHTASTYRVPDGVKTLHPSTFSYTAALQEVILPESLVTIRNWAFGHTGLKRVVLPSRVREVQNWAFGACEQLKSATLPASLETLGTDIFAECPLEHIYYKGTRAQWNALSFGVLPGVIIHYDDGSEDASFVEVVETGSCGERLTWSLTKQGVLVISGTGAMDDYYKYTQTKYDEWGQPSITTSYYTYPWRDVADNIRAVQVEEGVTALGNMAFTAIGTLRTASLPRSLNKVTYGAFNGTGLTKVFYAGTRNQWSDVNVGQYNAPLNASDFLYADDEGDTLHVPAGLTEIEDSAFENNALAHICLSSAVKRVGARAFAGCEALRIIEIPGFDTAIEDDAFDGCGDIDNELKGVVMACHKGSSAYQFALQRGMPCWILED